jgi:hypothetical protein
MYSLSVRDIAQTCPENKTGLLNLDNIRGQDLLELINKFCGLYSSDYKKLEDGESNKSVMKIKPNAINSRFLTGFVEYGHYGIPGKMVNIETKEFIKKSKLHSDIFHMYFCFYVPKGQKFGIALFHRIQTTSIKSVFTKKFNEEDTFKDWTKGLNLMVKPLTKETDVKRWMHKTEVKKLVLERFKDTKILGDLYDKLPQGSNITVTVNAPRNNAFGSALDWVQSDKKGKYHDSVDVLSDMCGTVKSDIMLHGKLRRTTLDSQGIESRIDISGGEVEMEDNYPKLNSLDTFARKLAMELSKDRN